MDYLTTPEMGEKWGLSKRRVAILCAEGRIDGAVKAGNTWLIPADAHKPVDGRKASAPALAPASAPAPELEPEPTPDPAPAPVPEPAAPTCAYFPCALATMQTLDVNRADSPVARAQIVRELALFRGEPAPALEWYAGAQPTDPFYFCGAMAAMSASVISGKYEVFARILSSMAKIIEKDPSAERVRRARLVYSTATASMNAPGMGNDWVREGSFRDFSDEDIFWIMYIRAKLCNNSMDFAGELEISETSLAFMRDRNNIAGLYLLLRAAAAASRLGRHEKSEQLLREAVAIAKPLGIIVPFVESATHFEEVLDRVLRSAWPENYEKMNRAGQEVTTNWLHAHNRFASDNLSTLLTVQEYRVARYLAMHYSYKRIAKLMSYSEGRIRNLVSGIYAKLCISGRKELESLIWV